MVIASAIAPGSKRGNYSACPFLLFAFAFFAVIRLGIGPQHHCEYLVGCPARRVRPLPQHTRVNTTSNTSLAAPVEVLNSGCGSGE